MPLVLVFLNHFQVNWPKTGFFAAHQRVRLHAFEFVYMDYFCLSLMVCEGDSLTGLGEVVVFITSELLWTGDDRCS